jgi:hypothetical protein
MYVACWFHINIALDARPDIAVKSPRNTSCWPMLDYQTLEETAKIMKLQTSAMKPNAHKVIGLGWQIRNKTPTRHFPIY